MATTVRNKEAWINENPLRSWRHKQGLTMADVSASLGVSFSSVAQHENGGYFPRDFIATYAKAMKRNEAKLTEEWLAWLDRAPSI